jgi:hypothetical protein
MFFARRELRATTRFSPASLRLVQNALARATAAASLPRMITINLPEIEENIFRQMAKKRGLTAEEFAIQVIRERIKKEEDAVAYASIAALRAAIAGLATGETVLVDAKTNEVVPGAERWFR